MKIQIGSKAVLLEIDSFGAELKSFQDMTGREYLWQGDKQFWSGQAPILFPIVGTLRKDHAFYKEKEIVLPRHGFARKKEFRTVMKTESSATFSLRADEETLQQYPFEFGLMVTYRVVDCTLTVELLVMNYGTDPMPYAIGGHPAFRVPILREEKFENYWIKFEKEENISCPQIQKETGLIDFSQEIFTLKNSTSFPLSHQIFEKDALIFEHPMSKKVKLVSQISGRGIEMEYNGFSYLGIWSAPNAPFVALEPWTSCATAINEADSLEEKRGIKILSPGGNDKYTYQITIL